MPTKQRITLYRPRGLSFWRPRAKYAEGYVLEGERHGKWIFWYEGDQKQLEGEYTRGKKTDIWTKWSENGQKITEGQFLRDKMHGRWLDWHGNGQKALESHWVFGKRDGKWTYWATDGALQKTERYDHRVEKDKGFSIHTDLEQKRIVRQVQREGMQRDWERLVGRFIADLVKPWQIACWILIFLPAFCVIKAGNPWRSAVLAGIFALLITSLLAWSLDKKGPSQ